jgi:hypothetical protein
MNNFQKRIALFFTNIAGIMFVIRCQNVTQKLNLMLVGNEVKFLNIQNIFYSMVNVVMLSSLEISCYLFVNIIILAKRIRLRLLKKQHKSGEKSIVPK